MYIRITMSGFGASLIGPFPDLAAACQYVAEKKMVGPLRTLQFLPAHYVLGDDRDRAEPPEVNRRVKT